MVAADPAELARVLDIPSPALLTTALTDRSLANEPAGLGMDDNRKLAFLGDAIVELVVREDLYIRFPSRTHDELSKEADIIVGNANLWKEARRLAMDETGAQVSLALPERRLRRGTRA